MRYVKGALAILALAAMIVFAVQNLEVMDVSFLSWTMKVPKFMIIVGTYVLGMITGAWLFDFLKLLFRKSQSDSTE